MYLFIYFLNALTACSLSGAGSNSPVFSTKCRFKKFHDVIISLKVEEEAAAKTSSKHTVSH